MNRLAGKVCLVTGAATGIGEAIAIELAGEGASVAIADIDGGAAAAVAQQLPGAAAWTTDVAHAEQVAEFVDGAARHFGRIDAIVNNAGVAISGTAAGTTEADWDRVLAVNLKGVWLGMRYALPHLLENRGAIVNMASVQAIVGFPGWAAYAATKGGIISLTQQAAVEYGPAGVRVNCLAPGTIMTPMNERIFATATNPEALMADWNSSHALGRFGRPIEVAKAAAFLVSDDASFITGACLRVDGGMTILGPTGSTD